MKNSKKILVGKKVGMSQIINEDGKVVPVTIIKAFENEIVRIKTIETDGYNAICIGYQEVSDTKLNKPQKGQFKKGTKYKHIKEFRVEDTEGFELNSKIDYASFDLNSKFDLQSKTIGRGFTGATKAWNFTIGPKAHGSKNHRLLGSIGQATYPGEVNKGKKMHTRYGNETVTMLNLELVKIDGEHLFFKGSIPGKQNVVSISGARR